jgi:pimeloyl-ACP methyl ester carboxylesterase
MIQWSVVRAALAAYAVIWGCASQAQSLFHGMAAGRLDQGAVQVLTRDPIAPPLRYRVIVIPGSGCTGMQPVADRYFAGLLHAEVLILHKPGVDMHAGLNPKACLDGFIQSDSLSSWLENAKMALRFDARRRATAPRIPQLLVGISEGSELLAMLAADVPDLAGLVLLSGSGLDPVEAGEMQARRLGMLTAWREVEEARRTDTPDKAIVQGRSLGYWRDLWTWRQSNGLITSQWPILQIWGEDDALVPKAAYEKFGLLSLARSAPICSQSIPGGDHGLQSETHDGVQLLWALLENWGRETTNNICGHK